MAKLYDKIINYKASGTRIDYTISDLVRCGGCKHIEPRISFRNTFYICKVFGSDIPIQVEPDGYCWKAEKLD